MERLTAKRAETLRKPGRYQAGDTVYLVVAKGRTGRVNKRWVQRLHVPGKRRDITCQSKTGHVSSRAPTLAA